MRIIFQSSDSHQRKIGAFHEPGACLLFHETTAKVGHFISRHRKCVKIRREHGTRTKHDTVGNEGNYHPIKYNVC